CSSARSLSNGPVAKSVATGNVWGVSVTLRRTSALIHLGVLSVVREPTGPWSRSDTYLTWSFHHIPNRMSEGTPNPAVNTDAPSAALRAGRGSPVTLIR